MLGYNKIIEAIKNGEIEIFVSFIRENNELKLYESEWNILESPLKDNIYSDRLKVTMGPIIKVLNKKRIRKKYRYQEDRNLFDLRESQNKYVIKPGESIIVLTNERIKLNGKYACLVVPRISLSDVGIVVTTAYVDPFYNGLMRLHLSNLSDKSFELKTLESIAQCFFFELTESVSETYKEQFSTKSVFFGQTWHGILESDRNPFPIKKKSMPDDRFSNLKYQWEVVGSFIKTHSLISLLIVNFFVLGSGYLVLKQNYVEYLTVVKQMEQALDPIASEIFIGSGETHGEKEITVDCAKADIVGIVCNDDSVHYQILSGDTQNQTRIIFSYTLFSATSEKYRVDFTYVIVRRIEK